MSRIFKLSLAAFVVFTFSACEKALELEPDDGRLEVEEAFQTKQDILEFLNSTYDVTGSTYNGRIQHLGELMSDNLAIPNNHVDYTQVFNHNTNIFNGTIASTYQDPYIGVFRANLILEQLEENDFGFSQSELDKIKGECYFLRAINHFEVVKLWGQPWGYTSDNNHLGVVYKTTSEVKDAIRPTVAEVYSEMISDLNRALNLLPPDNDIYATKYSVMGYLAKIYFQQGEYAEAEQMASDVINSGVFQLDTSINRFARTVSSETVFGIVSTYIGVVNSIDKSSGFRNQYGDLITGTPNFSLSRDFYETYSADSSDKRLSMIEVLSPGEATERYALRKFGDQFLNIPVIHLTGLKLLRAEALAELNTDLSTAIQDVNDIRERAYGGSQNNLASNASVSQIVDAARYERRFEMVGEGDRIQQLKRLGAIENESIEVRDHPWNCNGMVLQFPSAQQSQTFKPNPGGGC